MRVVSPPETTEADEPRSDARAPPRSGVVGQVPALPGSAGVHRVRRPRLSLSRSGSHPGASRVRRGAAGTAGLLALSLLGAGPPPVVAQQPPDSTKTPVDSLKTARDSLKAPADSVKFALQGLRVEAARPTITGGGASAVEMRLDSALFLPSPTLAEVLREMPLIRVRRNSRGEVQPSLRGMEEREIAVLLDGVPVTLGWDNRTDLSVVPLTAAREVRLVRGLSSVLAGPNALGGVVEVRIAGASLPARRTRPLRLRSGVDQTGGVALSGEAEHLWRAEASGGGGAGGETAAGGAGGAGGVWLRYGGGYRQSDGAPLARGLGPRARAENGLLVNSDLQHLNGFLALRYQGAGGGPWLSLSSSGFRAERGVVPELHLLGGPAPEPRFWRIAEQWRSVTSLSGGSGWGKTPWGSGDLEASVGIDVQHLEIDAFDSIAFRDSVDGETGNDRTLTFRLLGDHTAGPGILRSAFTFADTWHEQVLAGEAPADFRQELWSLGVETEQPLYGRGGSPGASLTAGFSVDGSSTPGTGDKPSSPAIWEWGARVAGRFSLSHRVDLHGGASRRARFPALRERFSGALGKFVPNPGLGAVVLRVGELGATARPARGLELQGTLFQQRLDGSIVRVLVEEGKFQRQNRGQTRSTGAEILVIWRVRGFDVRGDLSLQNISLREGEGEPRMRPEYQPEVAGGLRVARSFAGVLQAHAGLEVLGTQFGANAETGDFDRVGSSAYLELGAAARVGSGLAGLPPLTVSAVLENLTDEGIFDQLGLPRPGRTLRIQVEIF